jgi:hypothetical protein
MGSTLFRMSSWNRAGTRILLFVSILGAGTRVPRLHAQQEVPEPTRLAQIRWWHGLVALGGYALLTQVDAEVQDFAQDNRSESSDDVAKVARQFGQAEIYATVGLGVLAGGLLARDREVRDAGLRISSSLAMTAVVVTVTKFVAGRHRPSRRGSHPDDFSPFSGSTSAPSGHAAMAFALAASVGEELHNRWASAGLYIIASGTAWSRVNDNVHWFSDVVAGAALGVVSAKFMNGKLTIFGIKPPHLRPSTTGVALEWSGAF